MNVFGIILDARSLWLLSAAGILLAWLIVHRLAVERDRINRNVANRAKFRAAVLEALVGLYPIPSNWPKEHGAIQAELKTRFPALQAAVAEFRHSLPKSQHATFDEAWRVYRLGKDGREIDQQYYEQYVPSKGVGRTAGGKVYESDNTLSYKRTFKQNVDHLLSFAKET